ALAYWSTQDSEGWQGRAAAARAELIFPPQTIGEEMERFKESAGTDIDPGELADFRLAPPTIVRVSTNDVQTNNSPMPWNVQQLLDATVARGNPGVKVESVDLELLYGLGMYIGPAPGPSDTLRIAEL